MQISKSIKPIQAIRINEFGRKVGMDRVVYGFEDQKKIGTDVLPHFFEKRIKEIDWIVYYKKKTGKM